ncbi:hypothetical protein EBN03_20985 [Nocardia stercoris]|uniref:Sensor domain-containing protein n=2 Tax=Nocardia stercoris TaxID=2483361 RepID=A0A3M2L3W6_9NOCA|nr:hypothetical protein EBN03_20985 [Nocardia stercoris]
MLRVLVVAAAGATLLSGCGGSGANTGAAQTPSTPRDRLVLTAAEFPAGSTELDLPQDKLNATVGDVAKTQQNATYSPAECGATQHDLGATLNAVMTEASFAAATYGNSNFLIETVASTVADLSTFTRNIQRCPDVTMTTTTEDGKTVTTGTSVTELPVPPDLSGMHAVAYKSTSSTASAVTPLSTITFAGYATLRGLTVGVRVMAVGDAPDQAAFDQLFTSAVHKVQQAA